MAACFPLAERRRYSQGLDPEPAGRDIAVAAGKFVAGIIRMSLLLSEADLLG